MLRWLVPVLSVSVLAATACSDSDKVTPSGAGGEGGEGGADGCSLSGTGTLVVEVTGLPASVAAGVSLDGPDPQNVTESQTYEGVGAGSYSLSAVRVFDTDPIVRTVFDPKLTEESFCLRDGTTHTLQVKYTAIPSSNKLWTANGPGGAAALLGFGSAELVESGAPDATVAADGGAGVDVAFDRDGNLWSKGSTSADPTLIRFPVAQLGASGAKDWDVGVNVTGISCIPQVRGLAFDSSGNLWLSACGGDLMRIDASDLVPAAVPADVTPAVTLSGFADNQDLAFDAAGNLWLADEGKVVRIDAARLSASDSDGADRAISARDAADERDLTATFLAFDSGGNLWAGDFGSNFLFELAKSDLAGTGAESVPAKVSFALGVEVLFNRPAFDDSGALWISLGAGKFGALGPSQLLVSSGSGDPVTPDVVISSPDVGYANNLAFFPAAEGLPLYHSLP